MEYRIHCINKEFSVKFNFYLIKFGIAACYLAFIITDE
ncbi:putative membrane protein [Escherichia coli 3-105-05_S4_C2]|nr:putative membrane protein [Escherichia coli 3-105-05_S4_C2]